ncbi:hypothetical protein [Thermoanaerobacterium sp. DL9XJH110]|uniref:hypothetical protein n=1 Tax=Thermoanaerobacterium sp. DL9XJH110 TaxID=3386643 RepID=UPI003BB49F5F
MGNQLRIPGAGAFLVAGNLMKSKKSGFNLKVWVFSGNGHRVTLWNFMAYIILGGSKGVNQMGGGFGFFGGRAAFALFLILILLFFADD